MIKLNICKKDYDTIQKLLPDILPDVTFYLESVDESLHKLGLCPNPPCVVVFETDSDGFDDIIDELGQIEVDAFNTADGNNPAADDMLYLKYKKYGCLFDILYHAWIS